MKRIFFVLSAFVFCVSTQAEPKILARIALVSDPHVNRATNGANATFKAHFEKTIAAVNKSKVDFVLIAGDLTQSGAVDEMSDFKKQIKKFHAPVWFVPGNHDVGHKFNSGKSEGTVTPERVELYEKKLGASFFMQKKSGVRVIGINSSLLGSGFERENAQWKFLEKEFAKPIRTPTILFMHYPPFLKTTDEPGGHYYNIEPEPRRRLLALLKQGGVKTVLTGHLHRQLINRNEGILFLTTPPVSFGLPKGSPEGWTLISLQVEGEAKWEFQNIE
jgi:3',5'-cyclic AMP phosphodiesterase CpdA